MTMTSLLVAGLLALPGQDVPQAPATSSTIVSASRSDAEQRRRPVERDQRLIGDRPHSVGVGGQLSISNRGVGGGTRLFFGDRLGVNLNVLWYRNGSRYTSNPQQGSTFAALPSFILMLTRPDETRDVDIRPYVGGGVNYVSSSRGVTTTAGGAASTTTLQRRSGTGGQVFGGVEMTFREADWMTVSAEGIYYKLPLNYVNTSVIGGFNYLLAVHFYLR